MHGCFQTVPPQHVPPLQPVPPENLHLHEL